MTWNDFDSAYRNNFIKNFIVAGFLTIFDICILVKFRELKFFVIFFAVIVCYVLYQLNDILNTKKGNVLILEGTCVDEKSSSTQFAKQTLLSKKNVTLLLADGKYACLNTGFLSSIKKDTKVKIYVSKNDYYESESDVGSITNPIYIQIKPIETLKEKDKG